jgi:hypothetical protein
MLILLPLLAKLSPDQRVILGRTLVILGVIFLAVGFTGHPWLVVLSACGLLRARGGVAAGMTRPQRTAERWGEADRCRRLLLPRG